MNTRSFRSPVILAACCAATIFCATRPSAWAVETGKPMNVLFIAVDDLRPELASYGHDIVKSPHIDHLAARATRFTRAYCQEAICAPSRMSLLSGLRPDTIGVYGLQTPLRTALPDVLSLPQYFRQNGYTTVSLGKIYHHGRDDPEGWSERPRTGGQQYNDPRTRAFVDARKRAGREKGLRGLKLYGHSRGPATEGADVPDGAYLDGAMADVAIARLRRFAEEGKPFFLATGFKKPHLPFTAPKRYWDLYDRDALPLPDRVPPAGAPDFAFTNWGELRDYSDMPARGDLDEAQTRRLIHGYYACVSYVDAQIGRLLDALQTLGLAEHTAIVLWGDHGWKLGDYGDWCKHTNFEYDTRVPLIVSMPGKPSQVCDQPVELLDLFPTLAAACGLPVPAHCEGDSLLPLLANADAPWREVAVSQYPRGPRMGYSMRWKQWRYTEWVTGEEHKVVARELYDHSASSHAVANLADRPEQAKRVEQLSARLKPYIRRKP